MEKVFILDTNVLLYDPKAIFQFGKHIVMIPVEVIEKLDSFKYDIAELGHHSRAVSHDLDQLARRGDIGRGVKLENGGFVQVYAGAVKNHLQQQGLTLEKALDNRILNLAIGINQEPHREAVVVSKNINLRIKAYSLGVQAQDYGELQADRFWNYNGYNIEVASRETVDSFLEYGFCQLDGKFVTNEYILLKSDDNDRVSAIGRIVDDTKNKLVAITNADRELFGISPLNLGQGFAIDALMNDDIKLVTLLGRAGTGKTLLAVAAGLYKVLIEDCYNKLLVSRPTLAMGRDIGYLPGDVEEKMRPWMQPIYDALEMIRERDRRSRKRLLPPDIMECEEIGIESLTYIRGRSIAHRYFIIDEAQNLTPHEVKTIITRIGFNSKIVMTGDPDQIDNPYVDALSNGFSYVVDRFRSRSISAHISLAKGERSELAEIAAEIL